VDLGGGEPALVLSAALLVVRAMTLNSAGVLRDAKYTLQPADHATCHTTHGSANSSADRTRRPVANSCPLLSSPHDPLRLSSGRKGKNSQAECGQ